MHPFTLFEGPLGTLQCPQLEGISERFRLGERQANQGTATAWLWLGLHPPRLLSGKPTRPSSLKRLTQTIPMIGLRTPTRLPASEVYRLGSSSMAAIKQARCIRRKVQYDKLPIGGSLRFLQLSKYGV